MKETWLCLPATDDCRCPLRFGFLFPHVHNVPFLKKIMYIMFFCVRYSVQILSASQSG
jgi:hypothetical protein